MHCTSPSVFPRYPGMLSRSRCHRDRCPVLRRRQYDDIPRERGLAGFVESSPPGCCNHRDWGAAGRRGNTKLSSADLVDVNGVLISKRVGEATVDTV